MGLFDRLRQMVRGTPATPGWERPVVTVVVDDRTMLLGLDQLYREAIKPHERGELLSCARQVAHALGVDQAHVPVEGYYAEEPALSNFFRLMRALQEVPRERTREVERLSEFKRLLAVSSSPIFGHPVFERLGGEYMLPLGRDPLGDALDTLAEWEVPAIVEEARRLAREHDDCSLVGLAALAGDAVVLAALRESVVLYADVVELSKRPSVIAYEWKVDPLLERQAQRFVKAFNKLFHANLPQPTAKNAAVFANAKDEMAVVGRCARLGQSPGTPPRYYHWAVRRGSDRQLVLDAFWADEVWTTERYRNRDAYGRASKPELRL